MRILIDTDVLLDIALDRKPHSGPSGRLLDYLQRRPGTGCFAWHTASNLHYLTTAGRSGFDAKSFLASLSSFLDVAPASTPALRFALNLDMTDFEDAMQAAAASAWGADVIATRNLRDFRKSPIPAQSPASLLRTLASS